ncbi:MAG TPA: hypothetical protein VLW75_02335 [Rhizomicrobium sp.]|nr:hypothetical protein [Rhizomicrobium sp.]
MSVVFRFISLILIVVAIALLGADIVTSLEHGGQITVRSIDQVWAILGKGGDAAFKSWVGRNFPSFLASWTYSVMALPGWGVTGVVGVILAFLFGRRAGPQED